MTGVIEKVVIPVLYSSKLSKEELNPLNIYIIEQKLKNYILVQVELLTILG